MNDQQEVCFKTSLEKFLIPTITINQMEISFKDEERKLFVATEKTN